MKGFWHLITSTIVLVALWGCIPLITITSILITLPFTIFSDADFKFGSHRNFLFHSIIPWVFVWGFNFELLTAMICLGVGLHLLEDVRVNKYKWRGRYLLKFYKKSLFKKKSGALTTFWLIANFIGSCSILIITLIVI